MEKVKITAGQFEGLLIGMFLKDALKPVFKGYLNESGSAHDIYRYFLTNTLAQSIGRIGAMGFSNRNYSGSGSSTFSVVLAQYPLLRRRNLSTYFERYYRNV